jgi:inorganic triphosphatase YgiF
MGREFELKFAATPEQQETIRQQHGDFSIIRMETAYYDTPEGALSDRHITLRRRYENGLSVCTVKTPAGSHGRGEWETECDNVTEAIPVLCKLGCPEDLVSLTANGLRQVCGARFTRNACLLTAEGCTLELALDNGVLMGGGREVPLCEVELELKSGSEEAAVAFAKAFAATHGLLPEKRSKFRRALDLAKET